MIEVAAKKPTAKNGNSETSELKVPQAKENEPLPEIELKLARPAIEYLLMKCREGISPEHPNAAMLMQVAQYTISKLNGALK